MPIRNRRDLVSGLLFAAVGVAFAIGARHYPMGSSARPGAGYFPLILSVLMVLLGLAVAWRSTTSPAEDDGGAIGSIAWRPLAVIVFAIAIFGATINLLGLAIAVPLLVVLASLASADFRWLGVIANAVVLTVFSWVVFVWGLKLTIPVWPSFVAAV